NDIIGGKNDKYWDIIKNNLEEYFGDKDICYKLERHLSVFLDNITDIANINNKRSYGVNYWFEWLIMNKDKTTTQHNVCNPDINLYKITYMEELKFLFDYIEEFEIIKEASIIDPGYSCQKCFEYLRTPIPLYFLWKTICQKYEEINSCTNYIREYKSYHPKNIMNKLSYGLIMVQSFLNPCYSKVLSLFSDLKKPPSESIYKHLDDKMK
ncbi:hypothetical protein PCYB_003740, partial [Plasmodium cynomolgi strain B]